MNILFIEDEKELAASGLEQLELKGYTVFPAHDIAEARAVLDDPERPVHFVITDHRLPDGMGIELVIELKETLPRCKCAVVSGCFTKKDVDKLLEHEIPFHHKPLLYGKVIDELRRMHAAAAPEHPQPDADASEDPPVAPNSGGLRKFWPF